MRLPTSLEEITTAWLDHVLRDSELGPIKSSRILEVMHGTATKIYLELELASGGTRRVWIKTGFEAHSHKIGQEAVYAGEVHYYTKLAGRFETRAPACYYAYSEPHTGNSVIVMSDLRELQPRFFEPVDGISVDEARGGVASLARIHASSWMNPILTADKWLAGGGAYINSNVMGWLYSDENWASVSTLPRFEHLPAHLRDREMLRKTHRRLVYDWREAAYPYCMNHGDCHMGQGYILPSGEVEFLDWQCVMKNSWANDYANFIISGLSIADRRANEKDLLEFYLGQLKERGVAAPSFETAWHLYRVYAFKCIGMLLCKPSMQSEANCTAIGERNAAAIIDLDAIGAVNSELPVPA